MILVGLLVHGFDMRGLFINSMDFFPFNYRFFPGIWENLFASVEKYKEGPIF